MRIPFFVVDAFTDQAFHGNPAAVCLLEQWLPDAQLQNIAAENNLSETAFLLAREDHWELRWFTPEVEVPLCGHATLASSRALAELYPDISTMRFQTHSGELLVTRDGEHYTLNFPATAVQSLDAAAMLSELLQCPVSHTCKGGNKLLAELDNEAAVREFKPDFKGIQQLDYNGLIITARGEHCDFVSRFFAPAIGINEDPVTGAAHCLLTPYWAERLQRTRLQAQQLSSRGGSLLCELKGDRVWMTGQAVIFSQGEIQIP